MIIWCKKNQYNSCLCLDFGETCFQSFCFNFQISKQSLYSWWSPSSLSGDIFTAAGYPGLSLGISLQLLVTLVSLWGYFYSCWLPWPLSGDIFTAAGHSGLSLGISLQLLVTLVSLWGYLYSWWPPWSLSLGISLQLLATLVSLSLWGYLYSCWSPWSLSGDMFTAAGHPGISLGYLYNCWSPWSLSGDIFTAAGHPGLSLGISLQQLVTLVYLWGYLFNLEICRGKNCFSLSLTITM